MKKSLFVVLFFAVALVACKDNQKGEEEPRKENIKIETGEMIPVAVVNIDSVLANYQKAVDANESLMKKQEDARLELNQKERALNNDAIDFQNKMENNAFLSRQRAESAYASLNKRQEDLQKLAESKSQELFEEQQRVSEEVRNDINDVIEFLNEDGKYHLVLTTSSLNDNVLYCASQYDITDVVIEELNKRYAEKSGKNK